MLGVEDEGGVDCPHLDRVGLALVQEAHEVTGEGRGREARASTFVNHELAAGRGGGRCRICGYKSLCSVGTRASVLEATYASLCAL